MTINQIAPAVRQVIDELRRYGLGLNDLTGFGGEDLRDPRRREKARRVERCWALMARLGVNLTDLETALPGEFKEPAGAIPGKSARRRRHDPVVSQAVENTQQLGSRPRPKKFNKINDLANSAPDGGPDNQLSPFRSEGAP